MSNEFSSDSPIAQNVRQMFLDDLLASYEHMETAFAKHLYELYKAFEFDTLWDVSGTITTYDRQASAAAAGTGKLGGVLELTKAIQAIDGIEFKAKRCFTKMVPALNSHKWTFDNVNDQMVSTLLVTHPLKICGVAMGTELFEGHLVSRPISVFLGLCFSLPSTKSEKALGTGLI